MAISASYVVKETANNLRRNLVMTIGAMLTGAVSLALMGGVLLSRQAVNKQTAVWKGGVELSIFMNADATDSQIGAVKSQLDELIPSEVKRVNYIDHPAALAEMKVLFAGNPNVVDSLTAADAPTSFRVVPTKPELVDSIGGRFKDQPGVMKGGVVYAKAVINKLISNSNRRSRFFLLFAVIMLLSAILLIGTTIQLAIHARQREVAVMKLVGATNWFIRIPFMLEGMAQGLVGAVVAFLAVYVFRNAFTSVFADPSFSSGSPIRKLFVTPQEALYTGLVLFVVGTLVGAFGSAFAVRRFLTV
jgi:cell division transport system permease protein